jgi:hypothetical protein
MAAIWQQHHGIQYVWIHLYQWYTCTGPHALLARIVVEIRAADIAVELEPQL